MCDVILRVARSNDIHLPTLDAAVTHCSPASQPERVPSEKRGVHSIID